MKKKILSILCIFILISFLFINNSFAYEMTHNDRTFYLPDEIVNIAKQQEQYSEVGKTLDLIIFQNGYGTGRDYYIVFFTIDSSAYDTKRFDGSKMREIFISGSSTHIIYSEDFTYKSTYPYNIGTNLTYKVADGKEYFYSTADIYTDRTLTDFFFKAPVTGTTTLPPILEKVKMVEPTMKEILTLVPIMIILIVSYLGLRKGLTLLKILRKM